MSAETRKGGDAYDLTSAAESAGGFPLTGLRLLYHPETGKSMKKQESVRKMCMADAGEANDPHLNSLKIQ